MARRPHHRNRPAPAKVERAECFAHECRKGAVYRGWCFAHAEELVEMGLVDLEDWPAVEREAFREAVRERDRKGGRT